MDYGALSKVSKPSRIDIIFITLLAGILQFSYLTQESLHGEGDKSIQYAQMDPVAYLAAYPGIEPHPPLYYWVLKVSGELFGWGHIGVRLPSALAALLAAPVVYLIGRRLFDRHAAIIAGLIAATSPFFVIWGERVRMYALFGFFSVLSLYWLSLLLTSEMTRWRITGFVISTVAMGYTHTLSVATILAEVAIVAGILLSDAERRPQLSRWIAAFGSIAVLLFPWAVIIAWRLSAGLTAGANNPDPTAWQIVRTIIGFFKTGNLGLPIWATYGFVGSLGLLCLWAWIDYDSSRQTVRLRTDRLGVWTATAWVVIPIFVLFSASLVSKNVTGTRFFIGTAVGTYLLIGAGISRVPNRYARVGIAAIVLSVLLITSSMLLVDITRPDWRSGVEYIDENANSGDVVVSGSIDDRDLGHVKYYTDQNDLSVTAIGRPPDADSLRSTVRGHDRVWVIGHSDRVETTVEILNSSYRVEEHRIFDQKGRGRLHVYQLVK